MRYSFIVNFVKLVFIFIQKSPIISGNWERPHGNVKTKSPFIFDVLLCKLIASAPLLQYFLPRFVSCFDTTPVTTRSLCIGYRFLFLVENRSHQSLKFHKLQSWSPPTKRRSESYANAFPTISVELRCLECNWALILEKIERLGPKIPYPAQLCTLFSPTPTLLQPQSPTTVTTANTTSTGGAGRKSERNTSMSSSPNRLQSDHAEIEQIITEFFTKSLHIILEARSSFASSRVYSGEQFSSSPSSTSSSSSVRSRDKWFNLALRESPTVLENLDIWRQSNLEPLIVDVVLAERSSFPDAAKGSVLDECRLRLKRERIVERWVLQYESRRAGSGGGGGGGGGNAKKTCGLSSQSSKTYKRSLILLRSLYATARLLPAYKVFRDLGSSAQIHPFNLSCKVSSFVEPFTRREEAEVKHFGFVPVDTCCGRLCLGVMYVPTLSDAKCEQFVLMNPQFIPDYVGSPTTDPFRRYPSVPLSGIVSRSPGSPSSLSFARRHSWSNDLHRAAAPSYSPSPSSAYSDSHVLPIGQGGGCPSVAHLRENKDVCPSVSSPSQPLGTPFSDDLSLVHQKTTSFDDHWPSPPFSPSPSPSPPTHLPNVLVRSESDPARIPFPRLSKGSVLPGYTLPPSPSLRCSKNRQSSHTDNVKAQASLSPACLNSLSKSKCWTKPESSKLKELQTVATVQKEDVKNPFVDSKAAPSGPPRSSRSGSSNKFLQDELDDSVFDCPFAVDEEDYLIDALNRVESSGTNVPYTEAKEVRVMHVKKSQDAAVGALVHMLQSAPPLGQDHYNSLKLKQISSPGPGVHGFETTKSETVKDFKDAEISSSGMLRTKADALEEFKEYKEMKHKLIKQRESKSSDPAALKN